MKSVEPRMEPQGTPVLTGYSCEDLPSIREKRRNKAKYLTRKFHKT